MIIKNYSFKNKYIELKADAIDISDTGVTLLIGENGAGKSSFLEDVVFGDLEIEFRGKISEELYVNNRMSLFSYVPQNAPRPSISVETYIKSLFPSIEDADIENYLKRFNLKKDILKSRVSNLSGGEAVKICFISALLKDTPYIFLDEPTNNLDDGSVEELIGIVRENCSDKAIVIASHDIRIMQMSGKVIKISDGSIFSDDSSQSNEEENGSALVKQKEFRSIRTIANKYTFTNRNNIIFSVLTAILILILALFNRFEFNSNYSSDPLVSENSIIAYMVDYSFGELNEEYAKAAGLNINPKDYEKMMTYDDIKGIAENEKVSDIFIMDEEKCDEFIKSVEKDDAVMVSLPKEISDNYAHIIGLKDCLSLVAGNPPSDNSNDIVLSEKYISEHFNTKDAETCIGKAIDINGDVYSISGISIFELCWKGYSGDKSSLFYRYDEDSYDEFVWSNLKYKEEMEYTYEKEVNNVVIRTKPDQEENVLNALITMYPADNYYSSEFGNIWSRQHNAKFLLKLGALNLAIVIIFVFVIYKLFSATVKIDSAFISYLGILCVDKTHAANEYLRSRRLFSIGAAMIVIIAGLLMTINAPAVHHGIVVIESIIAFGIPGKLYHRRIKNWLQ